MNEPMRPIAGFINVDKPLGWTSSDVVAKIRAAFGLRRRKIKVGHGGTLDPLATGVLPICIGSSTRLAEFVLGGDKVYQMTVCLGVATDTYDSEGNAVANGDWQSVTKEDVVDAVSEFIGGIDQVPPMYSAIKSAGQPLYKLARQGRTVEREARRVTVSSLVLKSWKPPHFDIDIECGSGFYARSLAHDIGVHLKCGAHMSALRRTRAGEFRIADALPLERLVSAAEGDDWLRFLLNPDYVLQGLASIDLDGANSAAFVHGQAVQLGNMIETSVENPVRVYSSQGVLLGLGLADRTAEMLRPKTVFSDARMV